MASVERIVVWIVVLLVATIGAGLIALDAASYDADPDRLAAVETTHDVTVDRYGRGYAIASGPVTAETIGLVYYPGGLVDPGAYVHTLAPVAERRDVVVVIPHVRLGLSILDVDRADAVRADYPAIDRWMVGGHSLGGAAACRYAADPDAELEGLVLHGSYCDVDIADRSTATGEPLPVLSVLGTADGVIDRDAERAGRSNLPPGATIVEIEGLTHAQFGAYGEQSGDGDPSIDDETARDRIVDALVAFVDRRVRT
ncbi:MAG: alpha/beta hydrolase [Halobacteriota archaeon]